MLHPNDLSIIASDLANAQRYRLQERGLLSWVVSLGSLVTFSLAMGCAQAPSSSTPSPSTATDPDNPPQVTILPADAIGTEGQREALLSESWQAYRQRFIQADGRVIDWEDNSRTVSEGQAYAMLRAVFIDDPEIFELTLQWAEENLKRSPGPSDVDGQDYLWAWKWGERADGTWGIQDANFASDADIDAVTALILAARRWDRPDYLQLAYKKLNDLWIQSTVALPTVDLEDTQRYLLPGPLLAFQPEPGKIYINPSYLAPYAFRLFAEVDPNPSHDWMALVDSSYEILEQTQTLSQPGLPADWVLFELATRTIAPIPDGAPLNSQYSFDAYRVWWRVTWDAVWFDEPRAQQFLEQHLVYLRERWEDQGTIPAILSLSGEALADYEATAQYAMLYPAFRLIDPAIADAMYSRKLLSSYAEGIWDNADAYYVQNLAWLGLFSIGDVPAELR